MASLNVNFKWQLIGVLEPGSKTRGENYGYTILNILWLKMEKWNS